MVKLTIYLDEDQMKFITLNLVTLWHKYSLLIECDPHYFIFKHYLIESVFGIVSYGFSLNVRVSE